MEWEVFKYRQTHPKCKYCKYLKYVIPHVNIGICGYYECKAKDIQINYISIPRLLCQCYVVKE